jgi:hypothetical protein
VVADVIAEMRACGEVVQLSVAERGCAGEYWQGLNI